MTLGAAQWLHLLWLVPLVVLLLRAASHRRRRDLERLFALGVQARHLPAGLEERRALLAVLRVFGLGLIAFAAAQPRWGFTWEEVEVRGVEVVFAIDLSRSMDAQDISPSRLERARREVKDLLAGMSNDRVGMVIFAAGAYPRVPLTLDHDLLAEILDDTSTSVLQAQGSSLASALRESARLFGDEGGADRAVILLSDGESWDEDTAEAARELAEAKIEVYAIGVGTPEGAPIPEAKGGFKQSNGDVVLSRLDEGALSQIAALTGGAYVRSSAGDDDSAGILRQLRASLSRTTSATTREKRWDERFQWPLAAGLGLLLGAAALGEGRAAALVLALMLLVSPARAESDPLRDLTEAALDHPNDPAAQWALADGLYGAGRFDDAARVYAELAQRAPDEATRTRALYNAGVARYRAGKLDEAVSSWDQALQLDPKNAAAQKNREAVSKEIAARQQLEQQRQQQGQQGQSQDGQGESQDGQPQEGDPQAGDPQPGDAQNTQPQQGQPEDAPEGEGTRADQDPQEAIPSQEPGEDGGQSASGEGQPSSPTEDDAAGEPAATGSLSAADAKRMLDAVEEGDPRVVIRGRSEAKDW